MKYCQQQPSGARKGNDDKKDDRFKTERKRERESAREVKATSTVSNIIRLKFLFFPFAHTIVITHLILVFFAAHF